MGIRFWGSDRWVFLYLRLFKFYIGIISCCPIAKFADSKSLISDISYISNRHLNNKLYMIIVDDWMIIYRQHQHTSLDVLSSIFNICYHTFFHVR